MTARKKGKTRSRDDADVLKEGASIISIVKDMAEQVDTAYALKEDLEADLDATRKKLSEESVAREELETRVRSLEAEAALAEQLEAPVKSLQAQTALAEQLREDIALAEEERNRFADLLAEIQPGIEATSQERDSLAEKATQTQARVEGLEAEKAALEAAMAQANKAVGGLREEVARLRKRLILAEGRSADLGARHERQGTDQTDLMETGGRFEKGVKRSGVKSKGDKNKPASGLGVYSPTEGNDHKE